MYMKTRAFRKECRIPAKVHLAEIRLVSGLARDGAKKTGEIQNAGRSHDVIENKESNLEDPTIFMKANSLRGISHDVYEKKGT